MRFSVYARAWLAALLACSMAFAGSGAMADPPGLSASPKLTVDSAEPFGLTSTPVYAGGLRAKWLGVEKKLDDERVQLALCDGDREHCVSDAALKFLSIVDAGRQRDGRARLGEINRAINLSIRPMDDIVQYGVIDFWSSPLVTFYHGAGDCEDYAIAKYEALRMAGIAAEDLRIIVMVDTFRHEGHAVTAARLDGHWLILDNRRTAMIEDSDLRNYRPLFVIDGSGVNKFTDAPVLASMPEPAPTTPASTLNVESGLIAAVN
ncbi:MAG: transglutaminase-like cysteine peptidase [Bradyrhizobium sp.]|nr:transglutaminase-like cysteine peptidase [Bradyrhizobium sp.]